MAILRESPAVTKRYLDPICFSHTLVSLPPDCSASAKAVPMGYRDFICHSWSYSVASTNSRASLGSFPVPSKLKMMFFALVFPWVL